MCPSCGWQPALLHGRLAFAPELAEENDGYDARYFPRLAELEEGHFWYEARNRLVAWAIGAYFPRAETLLEVGCGNGYVLAGLRARRPGLRQIGVEISLAALDQAARRAPDACLLQADARRLPFAEELDVVGCFDTLEHVDDDVEVLRQMRQALRPGGGVVVTVPQHRWLWRSADEFARHKRRYERAELTAKLEQAGLRLLRTTSFFSLLLPMVVGSKLGERAVKPHGEPLAELRTLRGLGPLFGAVMRLEERLIAAGASLPAGSSLLAIASRG